MKNPSLLQNPYTEISTSKIRLKDNRRPLNHKKVQELTDSIEQLGLLNPITVTGKAGEFTLIAGYHRLEAVKRIGWKTIPAIVLHSSVHLLTALAAIDENLVRCELTALELAEALEQRKGIYEKLHPSTKKGGDPSTKAKSQMADSAVSFAKDTAAKTGMSERTVRDNVQIAKDLSPKVKEQIKGTPIAEKKEELKALASLPKKQQTKIVSKVLSGQATSVRAVVNPNKGKNSPQPGSITTTDTPPQPSLAAQLKEKPICTMMEKMHCDMESRRACEQSGKVPLSVLCPVPEPAQIPPAPIAANLKEKYNPPPPRPAPCLSGQPCPDPNGKSYLGEEKIRGKVCNRIGAPINQLPRNECPLEADLRKRKAAAEASSFKTGTQIKDTLTGGTFTIPEPIKIAPIPRTDDEANELFRQAIYGNWTPKDKEAIEEILKTGKLGKDYNEIFRALVWNAYDQMAGA